MPPGEAPVNSVDLHTLFFAHNIPKADGKRVLDFKSGSGVLGLVAAAQGAKEVVMLDPNPRAIRFGRFNARFNGVKDMVELINRPLSDAQHVFQDKFYLILSHPVGNTEDLDEVAASLLVQSKSILSPTGSFMLAFENIVCTDWSHDYNNQLCGTEETGDLTGNVVCRSPARGSTQSTEGIVYGWRSMFEARADATCGHFQTTTIDSFEGKDGPQACAFARATMACPHGGTRK
jgi:16S rRNA G966 N2-methylase RsmD